MLFCFADEETGWYDGQVISNFNAFVLNLFFKYLNLNVDFL